MRTYLVYYTDGSKQQVKFNHPHEFQIWLHNEGDHVKNWEYKYEVQSNK